MIIGIDIDNTISHTTEMIMHYVRIYGEEQGINTKADYSQYYLEDSLGWPIETVDTFLEGYLPYIYREVQPKAEAIEVIQELKDQHELVLITSRNVQFPRIEEITKEWLEQYGIVYDRLILNTTPNLHHFSKLEVCLQNGIQIMIEDHHQLAEEIAQTMPVILFDYPYNRHLESDNIIRVQTWAEVKSWVKRLEKRIGS